MSFLLQIRMKTQKRSPDFHTILAEILGIILIQKKTKKVKVFTGGLLFLKITTKFLKFLRPPVGRTLGTPVLKRNLGKSFFCSM